MEEDTEGGIEVIHSPNPSTQHTSPGFEKNPFPFTWYYRTEVHNRTDRPVRVEWFEAYSLVRGRWVPNNVKGRQLTHGDFMGWYADEDGLNEDGTIPPGGYAVCGVNWHGRRRPWSCRLKWVYRAVDDQGNEFEAEEEIRTKMILNGRSVLWLITWLAIIGLLVWYVFHRRSI
ncbi:hypothetical protein ACFL4W_02350 [Planctomycetota bacterium]